MTTTLTRIAAGIIVIAGLTVGSAGMAPVALAESGSSSSRGDSDSRTNRTEKPKPNVTHEKIVDPQRLGPVGLNGNLPMRSSAMPDQFKHFPKTLDQFKHLPFDPAMPGGD